MFPLNFTICATLMFEHLHLNKAYIQTLADNRIISRAVERLGMKREGMLRDHVCRDGQFKSVLYYGILAADWLGGERARQFERYGEPEVISIER
jgi:RimJ/RimL family protein N-acetyltransferase